MLLKFREGKFYKSRNTDLSVHTGWYIYCQGWEQNGVKHRTMWIGGVPEETNTPEEFHLKFMNSRIAVFTPDSRECEKLRMRSMDDCEMVKFNMYGWGQDQIAFATDELDLNYKIIKR